MTNEIFYYFIINIELHKPTASTFLIKLWELHLHINTENIKFYRICTHCRQGGNVDTHYPQRICRTQFTNYTCKCVCRAKAATISLANISFHSIFTVWKQGCHQPILSLWGNEPAKIWSWKWKHYKFVAGEL